MFDSSAPRAPVLFSPSSQIGYGSIYGGYEIWLDINIVYLIFKAFHNTPYPISDGEIAGDLPTCGKFTWMKSTFVPYCAEFVAKNAMVCPFPNGFCIIGIIIIGTYHWNTHSECIPCNPNLTLTPISAQSVANLTSRWSLTKAHHPPLLPTQRGAFARIMHYITAKGIFSSEIPYALFQVVGISVVMHIALRRLTLTLYSAQGRTRDPCRRDPCRLRANVS